MEFARRIFRISHDYLRISFVILASRGSLISWIRFKRLAHCFLTTILYLFISCAQNKLLSKFDSYTFCVFAFWHFSAIWHTLLLSNFRIAFSCCPYSQTGLDIVWQKINGFRLIIINVVRFGVIERGKHNVQIYLMIIK